MMAINSKIRYNSTVKFAYVDDCIPNEKDYTKAIQRLRPDELSQASSQTKEVHKIGINDQCRLIEYGISTTRGSSGPPILQRGSVVGMFTRNF